MKNLTTALILCSLSWISVSATVDAQSGDEVTLMCSNFSSAPTQIMWFRVVRRSLPHCIAFMFTHLEHQLCRGFQDGRYEMSSNISTVFLKIKQVNSSDSGLYFCGYYLSNHPLIHDATYLEVQEAFEEATKLTSVILGALTVFLVMIIIILSVKVKKLQRAHVEERNPRQTENLGSDELNYAAVTSFRPKRNRHESASEREEEPNTVYSAIR